MTNRTSRTALTAALGLTAALTLASCASTPAEESAPPAAPTGEQAPVASTETAPEGSAPADDSAGSAAWLDAVAAAIALAESEAGGTAFEIDDEDEDRAWEIQVAVGDEEWEVTVSADGTSVVSSEQDDQLDGEDRAALDAAGITLLDAIEAAAVEVGADAVFDDASLEDDDGDAVVWEVSFDDEIDVHVAVADGAILHVER